MTTFDEREAAFENKFVHDEEVKFRVMARRDKLTGLWAAAILGKSGAEAAAYATSVVTADMIQAGDEDVIAKLATDLGALSDDATIRAKLAECLIEAKRQLMSES